MRGEKSLLTLALADLARHGAARWRSGQGTFAPVKVSLRPPLGAKLSVKPFEPFQ